MARVDIQNAKPILVLYNLQAIYTSKLLHYYQNLFRHIEICFSLKSLIIIF